MDWKLRTNPSFSPVTGTVLTVVMDGVGLGRGDDGDAVHLAYTPHLDRLMSGYGGALSWALRAHGKEVGLPSDADMGNSEVGHNTLGAGRVFSQGASRVNAAIKSGEVFQGQVWKETVRQVHQSGEPLHLMGLLSDGNVHAHVDHWFAVLRQAAKDEIKRVRLHVLLDGRDVPETSALEYIEPLERLLCDLCDAGFDYSIASGGGRMFLTMDRYNADWAMVQRGWEHHVHGQGRAFRSATEAVETYRSEQSRLSDQNLPGFVIVDDQDRPRGCIRDGAAVVFMNFRGDRAIEISRAFEDDAMNEFDRGLRPNVHYAGMMQYDGDLLIPNRYLVDPPEIDRSMGEYLSRNQIAQFACSETQKYGHVTYFWNGNRSGMFDEAYESYREVPGDASGFETHPQMKAVEICDVTLKALKSDRFPFARINFANGDMVGHTGDRDAAVRAVEAVDRQVGRLVEFIEQSAGGLIVTADHGNADEMFEIDANSGDFSKDEAGNRRAKTSHTLNQVPCVVYAPKLEFTKSQVVRPALRHVASTALTLMGLEAPEGYSESLIE